MVRRPRFRLLRWLKLQLARFNRYLDRRGFDPETTWCLVAIFFAASLVLIRRLFLDY